MYAQCIYMYILRSAPKMLGKSNYAQENIYSTYGKLSGVLHLMQLDKSHVNT